MALIDRIKYDGNVNGKAWLVYKYPSEQFVLGSQLIVNQGQEALFFKGGEALDLFSAGTHTLHTGNLPLLNKLVNMPFGGKTPFSAEIYYINRTSKLDMNWGTANPFQVEDPKYGIILSVRSHGKYGLCINDSRMFVSELIGALSNGKTLDYSLIAGYFSGLLTSKVKNTVSAFMIKEKVSFLEVTAYLDDLSLKCQDVITGEFERFGVEIQNFYIEAISPPKEEFEKLRNYKEELALGNSFYQQRRSFDVMEKLAENPNAGGMANAGMGLGMGFGMMQNAGNLFGGISNGIDPSPINQQNSQNTSNAERICPNCSAKIAAGLKFCGNCGQKVNENIVCTSCGFSNSPHIKFCGNCGQRL